MRNIYRKSSPLRRPLSSPWMWCDGYTVAELTAFLRVMDAGRAS